MRNSIRSLTVTTVAMCSLGIHSVAYSSSLEQSEPSTPEDTKPEIIVPGDLDTPTQRKQILSYVRAVMSEEAEGQYAKFDRPICPSANGFTTEISGFIEQRIIALAEAAEIDIAKPGCSPNVHLLIVEDGPSAIEDLRQRGKGAFGKLRPYERDRIQNGEGPVYKWHLVSPLADDGNQNRASPGGGMSNDSGSPEGPMIIDNEGFNVARTNTKSLILKTVRQGIGHAFVVIEKDAILGLSPVQIADFAALMALARIEEGETETISAPSIRTLFTQPREEAVPSVTAWDLALLKSLYKVRGNLRASQQRSAMTRTFEEVLVENGATNEADPG